MEKISLINQQFLWSNDLRTYDDIRKIANGQGDNFTTSSLLDYSYFREYYKPITIYLDKQQTPDADPKPIQQIDFAGNLNRAKGVTLFSIIEEAKENSSRFFKTNS